MGRISKRTLMIFAIATVGGTCLHFVHSLLPNVLTALFSPVSESLWEHLKLLYWPLLVSGLVLTRGGEKEDRGAWALSLLLVGAAMLGIGYLYHVVLGGESLAFDIVLYVVLMALGFVLPGLLDRPAVRAKSDLLVLVVVALGLAMLLFTFLPPEGALFADPTSANTWSTIPC